MKITDVTYLLDCENRIMSVHGPWDEFAIENGGNDALAVDVCGRPLWDFVEDDDTRTWLEAIFEFVRLRGEIVQRPYRCDSPQLKRYMQMIIAPRAEGVLRVEHQMLRTEPRRFPVEIEYGGEHATNNMKLRCSLCGCIKNGDRWEEPTPEHAQPGPHILVAYTVCDGCSLVLPGPSNIGV